MRWIIARRWWPLPPWLLSGAVLILTTCSSYLAARPSTSYWPFSSRSIAMDHRPSTPECAKAISLSSDFLFTIIRRSLCQESLCQTSSHMFAGCALSKHCSESKPLNPNLWIRTSEFEPLIAILSLLQRSCGALSKSISVRNSASWELRTEMNALPGRLTSQNHCHSLPFPMIINGTSGM